MMRRSARSSRTTTTRASCARSTELVNAIRSVLGNAAHHYGSEGADPFSPDALAPDDRPRILALAVGWLLRVGRFRARLDRATRAPAP